MRKILIIIMLINFSFIGITYAQYKVFTWENFEKGVFPDTLVRKNNANEQNVQIIDYRLHPDAAIIQSGIAKSECGNYGIKMSTENLDRLDILIVGGSVEHDRTTLGISGKAIVQADIYLPADLTTIHFSSVAAIGREVKEEGTNPGNYRLGVTPEGKIFFSYYNGRISDKTIIRHDDNIANYNLKLPGWHRFQMVFSGQDKIYLYIDGKQPAFSPIIEPSLKYIYMGLMMAVNANNTRTTIVDNLSIQTSMDENASLPDSPWVESWNTNISNIGNISNIQGQVSGGIQWFKNVDDACAFNKDKNLPYLLWFYFPTSKQYQRLEQLLAQDTNASQVFNKFCNIKLDVNQLAAGSLAQKYCVYRFPSILIFDINGNDKKRIVFKEDTSWEDFVKELNIP